MLDYAMIMTQHFSLTLSLYLNLLRTIMATSGPRSPNTKMTMRQWQIQPSFHVNLWIYLHGINVICLVVHILPIYYGCF